MSTNKKVLSQNQDTLASLYLELEYLQGLLDNLYDLSNDRFSDSSSDYDLSGNGLSYDSIGDYSYDDLIYEQMKEDLDSERFSLVYEISELKQAISEKEKACHNLNQR